MSEFGELPPPSIGWGLINNNKKRHFFTKTYNGFLSMCGKHTYENGDVLVALDIMPEGENDCKACTSSLEKHAVDLPES